MTEESWDQMCARHERERAEKMKHIAAMAYRQGLRHSPLSVGDPNSIRSIAELVADKYGLTIDDLHDESRCSSFAHPRFEVFARAQQAGHSMGSIGRFFGFDHTSVLHGIRRYKEMQGAEMNPTQSTTGAHASKHAERGEA